MSGDNEPSAESASGRGDGHGGQSAERQLRSAVVTVSALAASLLAGYVLAGADFPAAARRVNFSFVPGGGEVSGTQGEWAARLAPGVGLLVALLVCTALRATRTSAGTTRPMGPSSRPLPASVLGWLVALVGVLALLGLIPMTFDTGASSGDGLLRWASAAAAGMLLAGTAEATRGQRWGMPAIVAGTAAACVMALPGAASWSVHTLLQGSGVFAQSDSGGAGPAWWWAPAVVAVAVLTAAVLDLRVSRAHSGEDSGDTSGRASDRDSSEHGASDNRAPARDTGPGAGGRFAAFAVVAVGVVFVAGGYGAYGLARIGTGGWGWLSVGLIVAIVVAGVCAVLLGDGGRILPAALAVAAVAAPLVAESIPSVTLGLPIVVSAVVLAGVAAFAGVRWPSVGLGFALLLLAGLLGIVTFGDPQTLLVFRMLLTAASGAYLLASCLRVQPSEPVSAAGVHGDNEAGDGSAWSTVLIAGALFVTSAPVALADAVVGDAAPLALMASFGGAGASIGIGVAMTLVVLGCAGAYGFATLAGRFRSMR